MRASHDQERNLELFAEELADQLTVLNAALLQLEVDPASPGSRDSLMRAAHTVKGAARLVGLHGIEMFSHAIEELLLAALPDAAPAPLPPAAVALLFAAFDRLEELRQGPADGLPQRLGAQAAEITALQDQLTTQARALGAGPPASAGPTPPGPRSTAAERVVKVDALQLNRIAALAGESMVAARWLQPHADALQQLRSRQRELADLIARLPAPAADPLATAIRHKERQCQQLLQQLLEEVEAFARRSNTTAHRLYGEVLNANMRPFHEGLGALPRLVRDLAASLGKQVRLEIVGRTTLVDRDILRRLEAPLTHAVRNAIDHGLETPDQRRAAGKPDQGLLRLEASHRGGMLSITVRDDGAGVDHDAVLRRARERGLLADREQELNEPDLLALLLRPGFSTAPELTELSGRGVGLDVVETMAREVGGSLRLSSTPGAGTALHLQLPLTLSVVRTLLVQIGAEPYAVPLARLDQIVAVPLADIQHHEGRASLLLDGRAIGLLQSQPLLGRPCPPRLTDPLPVMVISEEGQSYGVAVERFLGEQDLVVRPLDPRLGDVPCIASAALMGDGAPILVLDVGALLRRLEERFNNGLPIPLPLPAEGPSPAPVAAPAPGGQRVLVVDDSRMVRESLGRTLGGRGYRVEKAADGEEALELLQRLGVDLVVSDVEMPRLDGFGLVRRLRSLGQPLASLPVLIVSSRDREDDRLAGLQAGADRYLPKAGFSDALLLEAVQDLIGPP